MAPSVPAEGSGRDPQYWLVSNPSSASIRSTPLLESLTGRWVSDDGTLLWWSRMKRFSAGSEFPDEAPRFGARADLHGWQGLQLKVWVLTDGDAASALYQPADIGTVMSRRRLRILQEMLDDVRDLPSDNVMCLDVGVAMDARDRWGPGWQFPQESGSGTDPQVLLEAAKDDVQARLTSSSGY